MLPRQLMIELNQKCNLHCRDCYHVNGPDMIDITTFTRLIQNIASYYHKANEPLPVLCPWFLSEPMVMPKIEEYLKTATYYGFSINLTTNGTLGLEAVLLPTINYHIIVFSVDGLRQKTYKAIRNTELSRVQDNINKACAIIKNNNLNVPICIKLTRKGAEWEECVDFVNYHLENPLVKMVSLSDAFGNEDGPPVQRHHCRYLTEFMIIQSNLTFAPCCMRWKAIKPGLGIVDVDNPMESYFSEKRTQLIDALQQGDAIDYCKGCTSSYTGGTIQGTVNLSGKDILFKKDFYNMFFFNKGENL